MLIQLKSLQKTRNGHFMMTVFKFFQPISDNLHILILAEIADYTETT
jgi:hypothetical protein